MQGFSEVSFPLCFGLLFRQDPPRMFFFCKQTEIDVNGQDQQEKDCYYRNKYLHLLCHGLFLSDCKRQVGRNELRPYNTIVL